MTGLSRDEYIQQQVANIIIPACTRNNIPLLIDGDGLQVVNKNPDIVKGYSKCVLTPNAMEFKRLWNAVISSDESKQPPLTLPIDKELQSILDKSNKAMESSSSSSSSEI